MNRTLLIILLIGLLGNMGPAFGSGLIPGLLDHNPLRAPLSTKNSLTLDSSSLTQPVGIHADSATMTFEFTAENLLRTKTNDRLTADISTWGQAESIFLPLHIANRPTTFAVSHISSNASAYYDKDNVVTRLGWASDTVTWAINHSIGTTRIGIVSTHDSSQAPGMSDYPQQVFKIFKGSTPVNFDIESRNAALQLALPIPARSHICFTAGAGSTSLSTHLGPTNNLVTIPAKADTTQFGIDLSKILCPKLDISAGYTCSTGSGMNSIYRNNRSEGKLRYEPQYSQLSASVRYQKSATSMWETGLVTDKWNARIHGISIKGKELGIGSSFNDRVDFNADSSLSVSYFHLGQQRRVSDKWGLGWRYRLGRIESDIDGDYIGRVMPFNFPFVQDDYGRSLLRTQFHDLELSARYALKEMTFEMRLEQVIPSGSGSNKTSNPNSSLPKDRHKTTGGTSISLLTSYAF